MYPAEGDILEGKYRIERKLGEGGMGAVFRAMHLLRKAPVALKFMAPSMAAIPEAVARFMNEAVAASEISSDHVVRIHDVCRWDDTPYLVMEYLEGHDVEHEIAAHRQSGEPIAVGRAVHLVLQILRALQAAHGRGIVHRDLKPANAFLVTQEGEPDFVKLLDFGISKRSEDAGVSLTKTNTAMGTPLYMAPEQARSAKDADPRSDLYSVAAILYETLTGRPPLQADTYNMILYKLFQEEPEPLRAGRADAPEALEAVVRKGLAKEPSQRFQTAVEFAAALGPFAEARSAGLLSRITAGAPVSMRHAEPTVGAVSLAATAQLQAGSTALAFGASAPSPAPKRSGFVYALGGILLVGGAVVGTLAVVRGGDAKTPAKQAPEPTMTVSASTSAVATVASSEPVASTVSPPPAASPTVKASAIVPKVIFPPTTPSAKASAPPTPSAAPPPASATTKSKPTWGIDQ